MISIVNLHNLTTYQPNLIYIGPRRAGWPRSPLTLPYKFRSDRDRSAAIAAYRGRLWERIQAGDPTVLEPLRRIAELARSGDVLLGCWCAPAPCHGEVVKAAGEWLMAGSAPQLHPVAETIPLPNLQTNRYGRRRYQRMHTLLPAPAGELA
jgi:hypothetical protein